MKVNDAVAGLLLIAFAAAMMAYAATFPKAAPDKPGPALFPMVLGGLFVLCGLMLVARGLRSGQAWVVVHRWLREPARWLNALGAVLVVLVYQWAVAVVGFIPLVTLLLFLMMKQLGARTPVALATAAAFAVLVHTLFAKMLLVPLPWGWLEPVSW